MSEEEFTSQRSSLLIREDLESLATMDPRLGVDMRMVGCNLNIYLENELRKKSEIQQHEIYMRKVNFVTVLNSLEDEQKIEIGKISPIKFTRVKGKIKVKQINGENIEYAHERCWAATAYYKNPNHPVVAYTRALRNHLSQIPGIIGNFVTKVNHLYQRAYYSKLAQSWKNTVSSSNYSIKKIITALTFRSLQGLAKLMRLKPKKENLGLILYQEP